MPSWKIPLGDKLDLGLRALQTGGDLSRPAWVAAIAIAMAAGTGAVRCAGRALEGYDASSRPWKADDPNFSSSLQAEGFARRSSDASLELPWLAIKDAVDQDQDQDQAGI
jgi:hypothetical protein